MYISYDKNSSKAYIPNEIFLEKKEEIVNIFKNFTVETNSKFTIISLPSSLNGKKDYENIYVEGKLKQKEKSCYFCKERMKCATTNASYCWGLKPNEKVLESKEEIVKLLNENNIPFVETSVN